MSSRIRSFLASQFTAHAIPRYVPRYTGFTRFMTAAALGFTATTSLCNKTVVCRTQPVAPTALPPATPSLEETYANEAFGEIDVDAQVNFKKFHEPNEPQVINLAPHLKHATPGLLVTTGTERSFFELALLASQEDNKCTGLVIRDIDPQAIAYGHMVTMLLRVAKDVKDFEELSGPVRGKGLVVPKMTNAAITKKIEILRKRLVETQDLPEKAKAFYLKNLEKFAPIYFRTPNTWRLCAGNQDPATEQHWKAQETLRKFERSQYGKASFEGVQYQKDPNLFKHLQQFAKSGKILCTLGSLNDLGRLAQEPVGVVDYSNVTDYIPALPQCKKTCLVVHNEPEGDCKKTNYKSHTYDPTQDQLSPEETKEFNRLLARFQKAHVGNSKYLFRYALHGIEGSPKRPFGHYPEHLKALRKYSQTWMVQLPKLGWVSFGPIYYHTSLWKPPAEQSWTARKLEENLSVQEIEEIAQLPAMKKFAPVVVTYWPHLSKEKYQAFAKMPGWKEAFEKEALKQANNPEFKKKFSV